MMKNFQRPLAGYVVNLSISESDESLQLGFPSWQVNRTALQIVSALFGQGADLVFGHDWREDGLMEAVYTFARQIQSPIVTNPSENGSSKPPLVNFLPWPDTPYLHEDRLNQLKETLRVERAGLPPELEDQEHNAVKAGTGSEAYRYMRSRALTHMRHKLDTYCDVRLCIGGRRGGSSGRYPGVIEEAFFALRQGKPLYISSILGGASAQISKALKGAVMPEDFCPSSEVTELYNKPPIKESGSSEDRVVDKRAVWQSFVDEGVKSASARAKLTADEMKELLDTRSIDRVIQILLISLSRLHIH